jgi:hypothetical protein
MISMNRFSVDRTPYRAIMRYKARRDKMDNVYVVQLIDHKDAIIVGVFAAEGLAEMAREKLESAMSDEQQDAGIFYRITAYELGKIYG